MQVRQRAYATTGKRPLDGISVLDLSRLFAGNVLTQSLSDFGADVIKAEPLAGDTLRGWKTADMELHWKIYSRNKRSICLNFRDRSAIDLIKRLVERVDIMIESFRPGVLDDMGLAPELLLALNPRLVLVRISGWGQDGPYAQRPGFGSLIEGISGFASMNGFPDREPTLPPMYLADGIAGLYGASAVMFALREVEVKGGKGQVIDLPLLDPLFSILGPHAAQYRVTETVKKRSGSRSTNSAPRNVYRCKCGEYISISASTQAMSEKLLAAIGKSELNSDERFRTNSARVKNAALLDEIISTFVGEMTQAENVEFFTTAGVTAGPIYDISAILKDPHFIEREIIAEYPDDQLGSIPMHHVVPRLSETPGAICSQAPALGQHTFEVLRTIGLSNAELLDLERSGTIHQDANPRTS
jgi:formyl-CoA transferase